MYWCFIHLVQATRRASLLLLLLPFFHAMFKAFTKQLCVCCLKRMFSCC